MAQSEWQSTKELIDQALAILEAENPMTVRQLFWVAFPIRSTTCPRAVFHFCPPFLGSVESSVECTERRRAQSCLCS